MILPVKIGNTKKKKKIVTVRSSRIRNLIASANENKICLEILVDCKFCEFLENQQTMQIGHANFNSDAHQQNSHFIQGSRESAVVRALAPHQCGLGSIPGHSVICGLSLLLVLVLAPRGFSPGTPVFPSP